MWAPFGSDAVNSTAIWRPEPTERGTFNILSTCVLTLVLCVWTSLHLNIPEHGKVSKQKWNKTLWLFVGLFMPEVVAFIAFDQWRSARKLHLEMNEILDSRLPQDPPYKALPGTSLPETQPGGQVEGSHGDNSQQNGREEHSQDSNNCSAVQPTESRHSHEESDRQSDEEGHVEQPDNESRIEFPEPQIRRKRMSPWTKTHSHYAMMGGFTFDTSGMKLNILPENRTRLTLTETGLVELAGHGLLPDISEETIKDKSKANELAKTLVCIQAIWFCVQVIGRLVMHYPISLLEMNTFAHAICCLFIYAIWWRKPLDIDEPTLIRVEDEGMAIICARMVMESHVGRYRRCQKYEGTKNKTSEVWRELKVVIGPCTQVKETEYGEGGIILTNMVSDARPLCHLKARNAFYVSPPITTFTEPKMISKCHGFELKREENKITMPLTPGDVECFRLASSHPRGSWYDYDQFWKHPRICKPVLTRKENSGLDRWNIGEKGVIFYIEVFFTLLTILFVDSAQQMIDSRVDYLIRQDRPFNTRVTAGILAAMSLYGGVHLLAWSCPFSNDIEQTIWRVSSIGISASLPVFILLQPIGIGGIICNRALKRRSPSSFVLRILNQALRYIMYFSEFAGCSLIILFYFLARVYLLVECFRNLWFLSQDVYKVPAWTGYIPHFGAG